MMVSLKSECGNTDYGSANVPDGELPTVIVMQTFVAYWDRPIEVGAVPVYFVRFGATSEYRRASVAYTIRNEDLLYVTRR